MQCQQGCGGTASTIPASMWLYGTWPEDTSHQACNVSKDVAARHPQYQRAYGSTRPGPKILATKYAMLARMWRHGIHNTSEHMALRDLAFDEQHCLDELFPGSNTTYKYYYEPQNLPCQAGIDSLSPPSPGTTEKSLLASSSQCSAHTFHGLSASTSSSHHDYGHRHRWPKTSLIS